MIHLPVSGTIFVRNSAIFFGCLSVINSGMIYGWPAASLPELRNETSMDRCWIAVAPFIGSIIATPLTGRIEEILGPKRTLVFAFYPYVLSWLFIASSNKNFTSLFLGRFIAGISDGCIFSTFPTYMEDIYDRKNKTNIYFLYPVCFSVGILVIVIVGNCFSLTSTATLACIVPLLSYSGLLVMPESPYHLIRKNRDCEAIQVLKYTRKVEDIHDEYNAIKRKVSFANSTLCLTNFALKQLLIILLLVTAQQLSGITALIFFATQDFSSAFSIIIIALLVAMSILSSFFYDPQINKLFLLLSLFGASVSLITAGFYFQFRNFASDTTIFSLIPVSAIIMYIIFFGLGLENIPFIMINHVLSRNSKPRILTLTYTYSAFLATIVAVFFSIFSDSAKFYQAFYVFGACCGICTLLVSIFVTDLMTDYSDESRSLIDSSEKFTQDYEFLLSSFEISDYSD